MHLEYVHAGNLRLLHVKHSCIWTLPDIDAPALRYGHSTYAG